MGPAATALLAAATGLFGLEHLVKRFRGHDLRLEFKVILVTFVARIRSG